MFLGKTILNKLTLLWAIWKRSVQKKGDNKFDVQNVMIAFMFHLFLSFYLVVKRLLITKNSVVKIQNLSVNHESPHIKSNPAGWHVFAETSIIVRDKGNSTRSFTRDEIFKMI